MAYRRLCAMAFAALGVAAFGCSGNTTTTVQEATRDAEAPTNGDRPPSSDDRPPASGDQSPDTGDDAAGTGSGGQLIALCHRICDALAACGGDDGGDTGDLCEDNCNISPQVLAALAPCQGAIASVWSCALGLANLCGADGEVDIEDTACERQNEAVESCFDQYDLDDDDDDDDDGSSGAGEQPPASGSCTLAGGCSCSTLCASCSCAGGTAAQCSAVCAEGL